MFNKKKIQSLEDKVALLGSEIGCLKDRLYSLNEIICEVRNDSKKSYAYRIQREDLKNAAIGKKIRSAIKIID